MPGTYPTPLTKLRGDTLALSTSVAFTHAPLDVQQVTLFDPTEDWRLHFNPSIIDAAHYDASASAGSRFITDQFHRNITGGKDGAGSGTQLDSWNASDFVYLCSSSPDILGLHVDIKSNNGTASVLKGEYFDGTSTWADLSITDNTKTGSTTLDADNTVTWSAVTNWAIATLGGAEGILEDDNTFSRVVTGVSLPGQNPPVKRGWWMRLSVDTTLDTDVEIQSIMTMNPNTNRGYFRGGVEYSFSFDRREIGGIEALVTANTDTLQITWIRTMQ